MTLTAATLSVLADARRPQPAAAFSVWGRSSLDLHDAYWTSMGVCVVRPGNAVPLDPDAGLYLLTGSRTVALIDFRKLLDTMGWQSPTLCIVRASSASLAALGAADCVVPLADQPVRCAFTPDPRFADLWRQTDGGFAAWRSLKRRLPAAKRCIARVRGRVLNDPPAEAFLQRLAQLWTDPTLGIPDLKRVAAGAFALDAVAPARRPSCRHIWLGRGRTFDEITGDGPACILPDRT
jgi:hypothetical protein